MYLTCFLVYAVGFNVLGVVTVAPFLVPNKTRQAGVEERNAIDTVPKLEHKQNIAFAFAYTNRTLLLIQGMQFRSQMTQLNLV